MQRWPHLCNYNFHSNHHDIEADFQQQGFRAFTRNWRARKTKLIRQHSNSSRGMLWFELQLSQPGGTERSVSCWGIALYRLFDRPLVEALGSFGSLPCLREATEDSVSPIFPERGGNFCSGVHSYAGILRSFRKLIPSLHKNRAASLDILSKIILIRSANRPSQALLAFFSVCRVLIR